MRRLFTSQRTQDGRTGPARRLLGAGVVSLGVLISPVLSVASAAAECTWIVKPEGGSGTAITYSITFDGRMGRDKVFYGFTVADLDLAWRITEEPELPDLREYGRPLAPVAGGEVEGYRLAPDSLEPHTIYLATAPTRIEALEQLRARIQPERPILLSMIEPGPLTRGASDNNGALPYRSLPGFELRQAEEQNAEQQVAAAAPSVQICAYQVAYQ
jgi:hypothetical protein